MLIALLIFGVFCCSTSVLMIKSSHTDPILLASLRSFIAAVALSPLFFRDLRVQLAFQQKHARATLLPGLLLGIHFIGWIIGARLTPAANSTLIVNLLVVVMPLMLIGAVGERLTRNELFATAMSLAGVSILCAADFSISPQYFWGDVICFASMLASAWYMVLGRRNRDFPTLWLYVVPLYFVAGVVCLIAALIFGNFNTRFDGKELLLILGLGLVPTVLGHSIMNYSMQRLRGQVVGLFSMTQFIFAGVLAFFILGEVPHWSFYAAAGMIVAGAIFAIFDSPTAIAKDAAPEAAVEAVVET